MSRKGENIRKRIDGRWEARYAVIKNNGCKEYKSVYANSYMEVKRKREEVLRNSNIISNQFCKITFDKLAELWLNNVRASVKESSYTRYVRNINTYIVPYFQNIDINKISVKQINEFKLYLFGGDKIVYRGLSVKTISDITSVLKLCLIHGEEYGICCPDFSKTISLKDYKHVHEILSKEAQNRIEKLLWATKSCLSIGILLSLYTGIRIGELCALKWEAIDMSEGILYISQTLERISDLDPSSEQKTKITIHSAKTDCSVRAIPIPYILLDYLSNFEHEEKHYVLTNNEKPTEPHTFYMRYKNFMLQNGIPHITFHALRHTFATNCVELGFDTKALSEILGHSNVTTTLKCYVHPTMQSKRMQMDLLGKGAICGQSI